MPNGELSQQQANSPRMHCSIVITWWLHYSLITIQPRSAQNIDFWTHYSKLVKDLSGPAHPTPLCSGLLDCFPLAVTKVIDFDHCLIDSYLWFKYQEVMVSTTEYSQQKLDLENCQLSMLNYFGCVNTFLLGEFNNNRVVHSRIFDPFSRWFCSWFQFQFHEYGKVNFKINPMGMMQCLKAKISSPLVIPMNFHVTMCLNGLLYQRALSVIHHLWSWTHCDINTYLDS